MVGPYVNDCLLASRVISTSIWSLIVWVKCVNLFMFVFSDKSLHRWPLGLQDCPEVGVGGDMTWELDRNFLWLVYIMHCRTLIEYGIDMENHNTLLSTSMLPTTRLHENCALPECNVFWVINKHIQIKSNQNRGISSTGLVTYIDISDRFAIIFDKFWMQDDFGLHRLHLTDGMHASLWESMELFAHLATRNSRHLATRIFSQLTYWYIVYPGVTKYDKNMGILDKRSSNLLFILQNSPLFDPILTYLRVWVI